MTSDPFTAFGETLAPARKPKPRRAGGGREAKRREKALQERDRLSQAHRRWRKDEIAALLNGPRGGAARALIDFLDRMALSDAPDLIAYAGPWSGADANTRFLILTLVDAAIIRLREAEGLPPFDDLRDETFVTIRKELQ